MNKSEITFLDGPRSRLKELKFTLETMVEFIRGFKALHFIGPCITVFGSARFKEDHPFYELTRQAAAAFAQLGFTIMTGGGPGLMEAANRGAKDVGGRSVGCNIQLSVEQKPNPYLDKWVCVKHFFLRKVFLVKYSYAFVVLPGGYGTLDEYFEALTLIQTHKIEDFPIIIFGKEYLPQQSKAYFLTKIGFFYTPKAYFCPTLRNACLRGYSDLTDFFVELTENYSEIIQNFFGRKNI